MRKDEELFWNTENNISLERASFAKQLVYKTKRYFDYIKARKLLKNNQNFIMNIWDLISARYSE